VIQPAATAMTYRSVSASDASVIHAHIMCRALSALENVHSRYRTGCFEKCRSRPPITCRHEWHPSV